MRAGLFLLFPGDGGGVPEQLETERPWCPWVLGVAGYFKARYARIGESLRKPVKKQRACLELTDTGQVDRNYVVLAALMDLTQLDAVRFEPALVHQFGQADDLPIEVLDRAKRDLGLGESLADGL